MDSVKESGIRIRTDIELFQTPDDFFKTLIDNQEIDLITFTDTFAPAGQVAVYLRNSRTGRGFGGGAISIDDFTILYNRINADIELSERHIIFCGGITRKNQKVPKSILA
ncbi:MAG: hypothetical protein P1P90_04665 [Patescibacteria group bacterium]|nr:hypothetical protein [Patescibacteria group bacterium]